MDELLSLSAVAQASLIRRREISSEQLVRLHLARIAELNPQINAVVQIDEAGALESARRADSRTAAGEDVGPFHGVPFTLKDWIETTGLVCAAGMTERAGYIPKRDATVAIRMRETGAILLGKTNVLEENPVYGATRNPYDLGRSPGASSSGEAAIIAAGGSPMGLGSDSGGSLRFPAHCCGIATLKPTTGRVPLTGHYPRIGASHDPRTVIGPMSRWVEDLWPMLVAISGVDQRDPSVAPVPLEPPEAGMSGRRIGWFTAMPGAQPSAETVKAVEAAVSAVSAAEATTERVELPRLEESMPLTRIYWARLQSPSWAEWLPGRSSSLTAEEIERSIFEWDRFRRTMLAFMAPFDAIICPVAEEAAPLHGKTTAQSYIYTLPFSLTGWPAATVRAGSSGAGLPIGVQVVAKPWREADALAVAAIIESALGGWLQPAI
ncbi:MAG: amidase [bacterium]